MQALAALPANGGSGFGFGTLLVARRHVDLCRYASSCCRR
ncbi:putative leader peptide [Streptomyces sp. NPDC102360]